MKKEKPAQFSKIIIMIILITGLIFIQESYILAFLGQVTIAEELSKYVATAIVGSTLGYFLKAFSETKSEKNAELLEKKLDANIRMDECESGCSAPIHTYEYPEEDEEV